MRHPLLHAPSGEAGDEDHAGLAALEQLDRVALVRSQRGARLRHIQRRAHQQRRRRSHARQRGEQRVRPPLGAVAAATSRTAPTAV